MSRALLRQALDALKLTVGASVDVKAFNLRIDTIEAIEEELTKPGPTFTVVAWMHPVYTSMIETHKFHSDCIPLYRKEDL